MSRKNDLKEVIAQRNEYHALWREDEEKLLKIQEVMDSDIDLGDGIRLSPEVSAAIRKYVLLIVREEMGRDDT